MDSSEHPGEEGLLEPPDITQLLQQWHEGNRAALDRILPSLYQELHTISSQYLRKQGRGHVTLQPTALVNEAYIRLSDRSGVVWESRAHFLAYASRVIRSILINYCQKERADKRGGGGFNLTLEKAADKVKQQDIDLMKLNEALNELEKTDARKSQIVELKYFGGLTETEIANVLGTSAITIRRHWKSARAWLYQYLKY